MNKIHPKLSKLKEKTEQKIQIAIRDAVSEFEKELGLWIIGVRVKYSKDDYMHQNDVEVIYSTELPKGVR